MNSNQVELKITERLNQIDDSFKNMVYTIPFKEETLLSNDQPLLRKNEQKAKKWLLGFQVAFVVLLLTIEFGVIFKSTWLTTLNVILIGSACLSMVQEITRTQKIRLHLQEKVHLLQLLENLNSTSEPSK